MQTMQKCTVCGADMAKNAKQCPQCGAKNKKPLLKKWWFWLIVGLVIVVIAANSGSNDKNDSTTTNTNTENTQTTEETITYNQYDVTELFDALKDNALKAQNTYKGQYVELSGYLDTIDSDGKYIGVGANPNDYDYILQNVHCTLKKNSNQLEQVMEMKKGDKITVKGKISDVGEILGYYIDVDSIN